MIGWSRVPEPPARMMPFMARQHTTASGARQRAGGVAEAPPFAYSRGVNEAVEGARERLFRIVRGGFASAAGTRCPTGPPRVATG